MLKLNMNDITQTLGGLTTQPPIRAEITGHKPEFVDARSAKMLFGISRTTLWRLAKEGLIRSVNLRVRGTVKGRRLYACDSIRNLLA